VAKIAGLKPDMVLFGGDMVQHEEDSQRVDRARVARAFASLRPRLGKFAVLGNHDIRSPVMQVVAESILKDGGFRLLDNDAEEIVPGFYVAGTASWPDEGEDSPKNRADPSKVAWTTDHSAFSLLLSHEPPQARENAEYPFALQLSGHTHGGQIALPFTGAIVLRNGSEVFKAGFYTVKGTRMYVSRGIGTSVIRARFLTPPEIVVLTLNKK
jgi:predicted MPP superfamily phosphohydrolase